MDATHRIKWARPELLDGNVYASVTLVVRDLTAAGVTPTTATIRAECLARAAALESVANGNRHVLAAAADYLTVAHRALAA
jgi:hypothetical protein